MISSMISGVRVVIRLDFPCGGRVGHGKIALLEHITTTGSIAGAARDLGMSYPRALNMVAELDALPGGPAVTRAAGGAGGGRATLTRFGEALVQRYRALEAAAQPKPHVVVVPDMAAAE